MSMMINPFISAPTEVDVTWNPSDKGTNIALSNGNLDAVCSGAGAGGVRATVSRSAGLRVFEILTGGASSSGSGQGAMDGSALLSTYPGGSNNSAGQFNITNVVSGWTKAQAGTFAIAAGDYLMFALNFSLGYLWVAKNGVWQLTGDPAAGTNPWVTGISGAVFPGYGGTGSNTQTALLRTKLTSFSTPVPSGFNSWAAP